MFKACFFVLAISLLSSFAFAGPFEACIENRCGKIKENGLDDSAKLKCIQDCIRSFGKTDSKDGKISESAIDSEQGIARKGSPAPSGDHPAGTQAASGDSEGKSAR